MYKMPSLHNLASRASLYSSKESPDRIGEFFDNYFVYIIFGGVWMIMLTAIICGCHLCIPRRRHRRRQPSHTDSEDEDLEAGIWNYFWHVTPPNSPAN